MVLFNKQSEINTTLEKETRHNYNIPARLLVKDVYRVEGRIHHIMKLIINIHIQLLLKRTVSASISNLHFESHHFDAVLFLQKKYTN